MPKMIPVVSDWTPAEQLEYVQSLHPHSTVYPIDTPSCAKKTDQETWFQVVTNGNHYFYKLTVQELVKLTNTH